MEKDYSRNQHDLLVEMLQEQQDLAWLDALIHPTVTRHEPVVMTRAGCIRIDEHCRIDSFVKLEGGRGLWIQKNVHVASYAHLNIGGGSLVVGEGAAFASGSKVITGGNRPDGKSMSASAPAEDQVLENHYCVIGPNACLATNAVVLPGVQIGEGAVLAAGSVATKNIPPYEIWAGVPARKIADRRAR